MHPTITLERRGAPAAGSAKVRTALYKRKIFPWLLMAPAIAILLSLGIFPFIFALDLATSNVILSKPNVVKEFAGLARFQEVVQDEYFFNAIKATFMFTVEAVFLEFWAGLGLALLFRKRIAGKAAFRLCLLLPMVIPPIVVGLMWRYMLYPNSGLITYYSTLVANFLGVAPPAFLSSPDSALQTLIMIDIWQWTPFMFLILHAGLASIPPEPYEAAEIDGASAWRVFWKITMPLLAPSIMIALVIRIMDAFRTYDMIAVLTGGGPGNTTETLNIWLTNIGFHFFDASKAAALSFIILVIILLMSFIVIRVLARKPAA
jgi:multiple sugar transport system permease protein